MNTIEPHTPSDAGECRRSRTGQGARCAVYLYPDPIVITSCHFARRILAAALLLATPAMAMPWRLVDDAGPSPRSGHALAYDEQRGVVVMFGGSDQRSNSETWEWNGRSWTLRSRGGPSPRTLALMAYDTRRGQALLFGGISLESRQVDTWEWNGLLWSQRAKSGPAPRTSAALAYDSRRGEAVLNGGYLGQFLGFSSETWRWDGREWTPADRDPPMDSRLAHAMVFIESRATTLMFGGFASVLPRDRDDTWEWNGVGWREIDTANRPSPRFYHAMAYDRDRDVVVLHGGDVSLPPMPDDTWEFDGVDWTRIDTEGPGPRARHAMAYDARRGVVVLFGGFTGSGVARDTWEYGCPRGDLNCDTAIDLDDFFTFTDCLAGPEVERHPDCERNDMDGDGDIDLHDAATMHEYFRP